MGGPPEGPPPSVCDTPILVAVSFTHLCVSLTVPTTVYHATMRSLCMTKFEILAGVFSACGLIMGIIALGGPSLLIVPTLLCAMTLGAFVDRLYHA